MIKKLGKNEDCLNDIMGKIGELIDTVNDMGGYIDREARKVDSIEERLDKLEQHKHEYTLQNRERRGWISRDHNHNAAPIYKDTTSPPITTISEQNKKEVRECLNNLSKKPTWEIPAEQKNCDNCGNKHCAYIELGHRVPCYNGNWQPKVVDSSEESKEVERKSCDNCGRDNGTDKLCLDCRRRFYDGDLGREDNWQPKECEHEFDELSESIHTEQVISRCRKCGVEIIDDRDPSPLKDKEPSSPVGDGCMEKCSVCDYKYDCGRGYDPTTCGKFKNSRSDRINELQEVIKSVYELAKGDNPFYTKNEFAIRLDKIASITKKFCQ